MMPAAASPLETPRARSRRAGRAALALVALLSAASAARAGEPAATDAPPAVVPVAAADSLPPRSLASFPVPQRRAWQAGLVRPDRLEHASLSFTLAAAVLLATRDRAAGAGTAFALGLAKECWDARGASGFDPVDLAADAGGITLALVAVRVR